jgi:uncharacterized protein YdaU (DUF1376 family)
MPYYKWYPDDYLSSPWVMQASLAKAEVYRRLLDFQWKHEGCQLPNDIPYLRRLLQGKAKEATILSVLQANFELICCEEPVDKLGKNSFWRNARLYQQFTEALNRSLKSQDSAAIRWKEYPPKR